MNSKHSLLLGICTLFVVLLITPLRSAAENHEILRYSSSAQVREAFGMEGLNAFMAQSGIELDLFVGSSTSALHRLMNGFSDIASSAERLQLGHREYGYVEIPFCRAPLVVITHRETPVENITDEQLRLIFDGSVNNWQTLAGRDQAIVIVVPENTTSAYKNFIQLTLKRFDIKFNYMAYRSTDVVQLVERIPWSISFISQGAHLVEHRVNVIKINGRGPQDPAYPYHQTFSFITKGPPGGSARKFIDFVFSEQGRTIIRQNGLEPLAR